MTALLAGAGPPARRVAADDHDTNLTPFVDVMLAPLILVVETQDEAGA